MVASATRKPIIVQRNGSAESCPFTNKSVRRAELSQENAAHPLPSPTFTIERSEPENTLRWVWNPLPASTVKILPEVRDILGSEFLNREVSRLSQARQRRRSVSSDTFRSELLSLNRANSHTVQRPRSPFDVPICTFFNVEKSLS